MGLVLLKLKHVISVITPSPIPLCKLSITFQSSYKALKSLMLFMGTLWSCTLVWICKHTVISVKGIHSPKPLMHFPPFQISPPYFRTSFRVY